MIIVKEVIIVTEVVIVKEVISCDVSPVAMFSNFSARSSGSTLKEHSEISMRAFRKHSSYLLSLTSSTGRISFDEYSEENTV